MAEQLVEGQTSPVDVQLLVNGVPPDMTATTVTLVLLDAQGVPVTTATKVSIINASLAKYRFTPAAADLKEAKSPYRARWVATTGSDIAFFPSWDPDRWSVQV